jgi:hypothetical protein
MDPDGRVQVELAGAPVPRVVDHGWAERPATASATLWSSDGSGTGISV